MSNVVVKPAQKPIDLIRDQLQLPAMKQQLHMALPPHVPVERFIRVAVTALQQNPDLLKMDRNSLFASIVTAAQLGLVPDSQLGEAYFVPYKGRVQLIVGYRGLLKLARQGEIGQVEAEAIYELDRVSWVNGDDSKFQVLVQWNSRGALQGFYAVAKFRDGGIAARAVMTKAEVDAIRARSPAAHGPAWTDNYVEMGKKTVLRRLAKYLPLSTLAANAFRLSELNEELNRGAQVVEGTVVDEAEAPGMLEAVAEPQESHLKARRGAQETKASLGPASPTDVPSSTIEAQEQSSSAQAQSTSGSQTTSSVTRTGRIPV